MTGDSAHVVGDVVVHDTTLSRTTDAEEVFPGRAPWAVKDFTAAEIAELDAGSWFGAGFAGARVPTLSQYLETGCSLDQAAAALHIHRSTLRYRLGRIEELIGLDLRNPDTRFHLQLATRALATLEAMRQDGWGPASA